MTQTIIFYLLMPWICNVHAHYEAIIAGHNFFRSAMVAENNELESLIELENLGYRHAYICARVRYARFLMTATLFQPQIPHEQRPQRPQEPRPGPGAPPQRDISYDKMIVYCDQFILLLVIVLRLFPINRIVRLIHSMLARSR